MNHQANESSPHDLPCVWMEAGLVAYKLCDRDLECEGCPFDAALRGHSGEPAQPVPTVPMTFPEDRRYTRGHQWLMATPEGRLRTGLDAMVGQLSGPVQHVRRMNETCRCGEPLFELEANAGHLVLQSVIDATGVRMNPRVLEDPHIVSTDPYGAGWLAEFDDHPALDEGRLLTAEQARVQARLDVRAIRRRVALLLLSNADEVGPTLADGGVIEKDIPSMIGAARYFEILREVLY